MKKILCCLNIINSFFGAFAQKPITQKRSNAKMNATHLLIFNFFEISGEYLIHEKSAIRY